MRELNRLNLKKLLVVGFILFVVGVIYIIVGAISLVYEDKYDILLNTREFQIASVLLLIAGIFFIILSIFAVYAIKCYSVDIFHSFIFFLLMALLFVIFAGSLACRWETKRFHEFIETNICDVRMKYGRDDVVTDYIDMAQKELQCCGSTSYFDYVGSYWWWKHGNGKYAVPQSCCVNPSTNSYCNEGRVPRAADIANSEFINTKGCAIVIKEWMTRKIGILCGFAFGLAFVLFLCLFGLLITPTSREESRHVSQTSSITPSTDDFSSIDIIAPITYRPSLQGKPSSFEEPVPKRKPVPPAKPPRPSLEKRKPVPPVKPPRLIAKPKGNPRSLAVYKRDALGRRITKIL